MFVVLSTFLFTSDLIMSEELEWEMMDIFESGMFAFPIWEHNSARQIVRYLMKRGVIVEEIADAIEDNEADVSTWLNHGGKYMVGEWMLAWMNECHDDFRRQEEQVSADSDLVKELGANRPDWADRRKSSDGSSGRLAKRRQSIFAWRHRSSLWQTVLTNEMAQLQETVESSESEKSSDSTLTENEVFYASIKKHMSQSSAPPLPPRKRALSPPSETSSSKQRSLSSQHMVRFAEEEEEHLYTKVSKENTRVDYYEKTKVYLESLQNIAFADDVDYEEQYDIDYSDKEDEAREEQYNEKNSNIYATVNRERFFIKEDEVERETNEKDNEEFIKYSGEIELSKTFSNFEKSLEDSKDLDIIEREGKTCHYAIDASTQTDLVQINSEEETTGSKCPCSLSYYSKTLPSSSIYITSDKKQLFIPWSSPHLYRITNSFDKHSQVVWQFNVNDSKRTLKDITNILNAYRLHSDWFRCSLTTVMAAVSQAMRKK
ncbi:DgyrCDS8697 [Dimorphilus gyrociliatus]|uniref:DgyrCDS8697 n=1 Tax=Dimorphilus gyrociliatus TaxID=2664684 RepID=A0A7I8VUW6_9ANNE|nr:DgyrCDS8697 [Dimorphilus gyrociliatus]